MTGCQKKSKRADGLEGNHKAIMSPSESFLCNSSPPSQFLFPQPPLTFAQTLRRVRTSPYDYQASRRWGAEGPLTFPLDAPNPPPIFFVVSECLFAANSVDSACVAVGGITSLDELCLLVSLHKPITE